MYSIRSALQPAQINAQPFRKELIEEWKACVKFTDEQSNPTTLTGFDRIKTTVTFTEIIQVLSEISFNLTNNGNKDQNSMEITDANWKYDIIRKIGAPWNWIYQFVDHYQPSMRSYNFFECQHEREVMEPLTNLENLNFTASGIPGVGPIIAVDVMDAFINFVQSKAMKNDGIVSPAYFKDENCPRMC